MTSQPQIFFKFSEEADPFTGKPYSLTSPAVDLHKSVPFPVLGEYASFSDDKGVHSYEIINVEDYAPKGLTGNFKLVTLGARSAEAKITKKP